METIKNFLVGIVIMVVVLVVVGLSFFLWPILVGLGSFLLFVTVIVLAILLGFYIILLIGYIVRKGIFRKSWKK